MIRVKSHSTEFPSFLCFHVNSNMRFQIQETQHDSTQGQKIWKVIDVIKILKQQPSTNSEIYLENGT